MAGRKSKYETHVEPNVELITGWLRSGFTEASIAKRLGVGSSTWAKYKTQNVEFQEVIKKGQQDIAALAVNSLLKRATGYDYEETHIETKTNPQGEVTQTKKIVKKYVAPDVGAICVILFNRMKDKWQNKQEVKHVGGEDWDKPIQIELVSPSKAKDETAAG